MVHTCIFLHVYRPDCIICEPYVYYFHGLSINRLGLTVARMRHWTGSNLVLLMPCHLSGSTPYSEPMPKAKLQIWNHWYLLPMEITKRWSYLSPTFLLHCLNYLTYSCKLSHFKRYKLFYQSACKKICKHGKLLHNFLEENYEVGSKVVEEERFIFHWHKNRVQYFKQDAMFATFISFVVK